MQSIEEYLWGICQECSLIPQHTFDTIYIGGGTPGVLTAKNFDRLCSALTKNNFSKKFDEFSVEFSPSTVRRDKLEVLMAYGCNRITMGVQSFDEQTLSTLGRRQSLHKIYQACEIIQMCNFENFGIDLIFAVPGQSIEQWVNDLSKAVSLHPQHISTYNLTFEDGTPITNKSLSLSKKSKQEEVDFFITTVKFLESNGYIHYEISNFCKPGYESRHNCNTWQMNDWIGVGPSACSQYKMHRFANPASTKIWLNSLKTGKITRAYDEELSVENFFKDHVIFGLRMTDGIDLKHLREKFPNIDHSKLQSYFNDLAGNDLVIMNNDRIQLTLQGQLVADAIAVGFLQKFND